MAEKKDKPTDPKAEEKDAAQDAFAFFDGGDTAGYEQLNGEVMSFPFIKLLQDLSPQCKKTHADYVEGAESGLLFNTVTSELLTAPLQLVIGKFERYYIAWKPKRGGFAGVFAPYDVEHGETSKRILRDPTTGVLTDMENQNTYKDTYVYYALLPDHMDMGVVILSLSASQLKEARKLNRLLMSTVLPGTSRKALPHFMRWELSTPVMNNDQGDWYGVKFTFVDFLTPETYALVQEERKAMATGTVDLRMLAASDGEVIDIDADGQDTPSGGAAY